MLALQNERYKNNETFLNSNEMSSLLPKLKRSSGFEWLKEVSSASLQYACADLYASYCLFFNHRSNKPCFKRKKKSKQSYRVSNNYFYFDCNYIQVQKVGRVKYKSDFVFPNGNEYRFLNIRISFENKKWFVSFGFECENQAYSKLTDDAMGIDLGIKELAVVAYGDKQFVFHNINKSKKMRNLDKRISHQQRVISRKYLCSKMRTGRYEETKNIVREREKLQKLYIRQKNIRKDYLHQVTHKLVVMLPCCVTMEDLNIVGMMKNKHLSKAVGEQNFSEFIRQIKYKCEWNGIPFVQVDRFYPSSKTCSCCGSIKRDLKLSDRLYICSDCGLVIDRDYNAAINLMKYGTH